MHDMVHSAVFVNRIDQAITHLLFNRGPEHKERCMQHNTLTQNKLSPQPSTLSFFMSALRKETILHFLIARLCFLQNKVAALSVQ